MDLPITLVAQQPTPIKLFSADINFGDLLGLTISQKLSPTCSFKIVPPYEFCNCINLLSIGSILKGADVNSIVWGAGFIDTKEHLQSKPKAIQAVRGPLTNKKIQQQGLPPAKVLGDPACLISLFFDQNVRTQYKYGIIPHYVDKHDKRVIMSMMDNDVLVIDTQQDPIKVLNQIKSCSYILSSSLHGLICADAFNIPAIYIKISNKLAGNGFKFIDYFLSCGRNDHLPYIIEDCIDYKKALKKIEIFKNKINISALKDCFPLI